MQFEGIWKSLFIILLFVGAAWSATLWPTEVIIEVNLPLIDGVIVEEEYFETIILKDVEVHFSNDGEFIFIGLRSSGNGWVAVGFSPVDVHGGANFLLGAVVDGEARVSDEYGSGQYEHVLDTSLGGSIDIVEFAGTEASGTVFELKIPLDSGDSYDVVLETGNIYSIIVAYHESEDDFQIKHTARFHQSIAIH
jgi:hypothetical protein